MSSPSPPAEPGDPPIKGGLFRGHVRLRRIPVVVLTRSNADQDILLCYDLGANGFVTKPADPDEFVAVVGAIESFWPATAALPPS